MPRKSNRRRCNDKPSGLMILSEANIFLLREQTREVLQAFESKNPDFTVHDLIDRCERGWDETSELSFLDPKIEGFKMKDFIQICSLLLGLGYHSKCLKWERSASQIFAESPGMLLAFP
jgi:hypothetical protein